MNPLLVVDIVCLVLSGMYAMLFFRNLHLYALPSGQLCTDKPPGVSVLIPARNEEAVIGAAVEAALASVGVEVEIIVLDDHSDDTTGLIVSAISSRDPRVRLELAPALPPGWCGKQFACSILSTLASYEILCFVDSDVRLRPEGLACMVRFLQSGRASLVSGFPHQELGTFYEKLLLPLMHFLLLGYLPLDFMRLFSAPSLAAGCGQLFVADKISYRKAGGHAAIRNSRHDGITLPRAFRKHGLYTDLCDASMVADCRMYRNANEVFSGLLKNANEGVATPVRIIVFTVLLLGGHVVPELVLLYSLYRRQFGPVLVISLAATILSLLPRIVAARRFKQPLLEAFLHPFAILVFLGLQWRARYRDIAGTPAVWKGRTYQTT